MTHMIRAAAVTKWRIALAGLVSALLSVAAFMASSPGTASANHRENGRCDRGDFCMGRLLHLTGGLYTNPASDPNLGDDRFVYYTDPRKNRIVEDDTWSVFNNGIVVASGRNDVLVYSARYYGVVGGTPPRYTGSTACVRLGRRLDLPMDWRDKISSFRWVTRAECNRHRQL